MEPITSTLLFLVNGIFSGWLGNRSDYYLTKVPALLARLRDTEIPANQDLQKAIVSSHWLATEVFCKALLKNNPHDILGRILDEVKKRIKQINQKDYRLANISSPDNYEINLSILKEKETPEILKGNIIEHHIKEIKKLLKEREVDSTSFETLENAIRNGLADAYLNWFDSACAFLSDLLTGDNNKAKDIFQNLELTKIGFELSEVKELVIEFTKATEGFVTKIGEDRFEELKVLVADELKIVKEVVFKIDETTIKTLEIVTELKEGLLIPTPQYAQKLTPIPELGTFIGRGEDLIELTKTLATANQVVLMNGMGGIGKTTLARAYINRNLSTFNHIAWISVTGDNIKEAFVNTEYFDETLQVAQLKDGDSNTRFMAIMQTLNNLQGTGLLVIDNAEKDVEQIKQLLPPPPQWQILLTSRLELKAFKEVRLEKLSPEYAEEVFREYYNKAIKESDYPIFQSLLKEIDYHTLTIELVAKTMRESDNNLKFAEVLEKLKQRQLDDRRMRELIHVRHFDDNKAVLYNHLIATFNLSQLSKYEIWVLKQFTALPPEPILKDTLIEWLRLDKNTTFDFEQGLRTLRNKGWLVRTEDIEGNAQYSIHRLIQDMVHYQYGISFEDIIALINTFIDLLHFDTSTNFSLKFPLIPFVEYILNSLSENSEHIATAYLYNNLGEIYRNFSDLSKAHKYLLKAIEINKKQNFYIGLSSSQSNLALVYQDLGDYQEAKDLLELVLASDIKNFGDSHPTVSISQTNLAMVNQHLGNYQVAKDLLELALNSDIKNFGHSHPNVALNHSNLALLHRDLGNYKEAKGLLKLALKSDIKSFGINHPKTSIRQSNLAMINKDLGNYKEAKSLLELALSSDINNFGHNHPKVAISKLNLATTWISLKNLQESKNLLESAYEIFLSRLGEDHPDTKNCKSWLDFVNEQLG